MKRFKGFKLDINVANTLISTRHIAIGISEISERYFTQQVFQRGQMMSTNVEQLKVIKTNSESLNIILCVFISPAERRIQPIETCNPHIKGFHTCGSNFPF